MAIGTGAALAMGGMGLLGGIAGGMSDKGSQRSGTHLWMPESELEGWGKGTFYNTGRDFEALLGRGPGGQDVSNAYLANKDLAALFGQYASSGGIPGQQDMTAGMGLASDLFAARRQGLLNSFSDQMTSANRQAAMMGRDPNDPVFRAKLMEEQTRQQGMLGAEQSAYGTQLAMALPGQRLGFAQQRAEMLNMLSSQAMQNRATLMGLGQQALGMEREWRLANAEKWGNTESGGGFKGALTGAIGGMGSGLGMMQGFGNLGMMNSFSGAMNRIQGAGMMSPNGLPAPTWGNVNTNSFSNALQMPQFGGSTQFGQPRGFGLGFGGP